MLKWVTLMAHHRGGEGPTIRYTHDFFRWLECQILMIQDFPYAGMDYMGDIDMPILTRM